MKCFRYKIDQFLDMGDLNRALQKYGAEGWELVTITRVPKEKKYGEGGVLFIFLKQEYENQENL